MDKREKKREISCPRCKESITKVINVHGTNRFYHYRGNKPPCTIKADLVTSGMEIIKSRKKAKKEIKPPQEGRKKVEKKEEIPSPQLPISDQIKKKHGIQDMEILPQEKPSYEILEEILRNYGAKEKIIKLLVRKAARRDFTPDEVQYNLTQLGVRENEADWIADEYNDVIIEEQRKRSETEKPRPGRREVIREDQRRPYRRRDQEWYSDSEAYPIRDYNRGESRWNYPDSKDSTPLTQADISKIIDDAVMKRDKEEKITKLSNSIKNLETSLKEEIQRIRTEIPTDSDIMEKVREVRGKDENKEREYEKILEQEIEDLKEERDEVKKETEEKLNELKDEAMEKSNEAQEALKEKEKEFKDKIEPLERNKKTNQPQSNQHQSNPDNEETWRHKSDITEKVMEGATTITNDILNEAPIQKALNMLVRGTRLPKENS